MDTVTVGDQKSWFLGQQMTSQWETTASKTQQQLELPPAPDSGDCPSQPWCPDVRKASENGFWVE